MKKLKQIETDRLVIIPLTEEELHLHIMSPDEFAAGLGCAPSESLLDGNTREAILNDLLPNITDPSKNQLFNTMWIITTKQNKSIIGGFCFHGDPDEHGCVELGYGTDLAYRNQGFMTETLCGIIGWLRNIGTVNAVIGSTEKSNLASVRVLEKLGFSLDSSEGDTVKMKLFLSQ